MKIKLFFLIWALEVGGAERLLVKLVQAIPRDEYDITVVCISREGVWAQEVKVAGIKVICLNKRTGFDPFILPKLINIFRTERPDIVNTYLWTADLWGRMAAIFSGVRTIIVTEQNVDLWKKWYHFTIDRFLFKWTSKVICVSHEVVNFYNEKGKVPKTKLRMIPNAIDVSLFDLPLQPSGLRQKLGVREQDFVFICAARLHEQKSHDVLLQAVKLLRNRQVGPFHLLLVGDGERREELQQVVGLYGISELVHFLGLRHDIPEILLQSDAFVLSSDYEGLSLAILEAMAAKLPVVATSVGGNPQIVENRLSGYLVPPQNPGELADAMAEIMRDRTESRKMGNAGRQRIEKEYEIQAITRQTLDIFAECLHSR